MIASYFFDAAAQAAADGTIVGGGILTAIISMLGIAGFAMKRMVDTHFEDYKEIRGRVKSLEDQENTFIQQVSELKNKLETAALLSERQKEEYDRQLQSLEQRHQQAMRDSESRHQQVMNSKDGEISRLTRELDELRQKLEGFQSELAGSKKVAEERDRLQKTADQLRREIRALVRSQSFEHEVRMAYEKRLQLAGVDTQELTAIKDEIETSISKAGDEPL